MAAAHLFSPTSSFLPNTAMLLHLFCLGMGTFALLRPKTFVEKAFAYPLPADPKARNVACALARLFGVRDIFMGLAAFGAWYTNDRPMLGYLVLLGAGAAAVDGFAQRSVTGEGTQWKHWWLVPVLVAIGAGLMGGLDGWV